MRYWTVWYYLISLVSANYTLPSTRKLISSRPGQSAPASPRVKRQYSRTTSHDQFPAQSSSVPSSPKSKGMSLFLRQQQRLISLGADIPGSPPYHPKKKKKKVSCSACPFRLICFHVLISFNLFFHYFLKLYNMCNYFFLFPVCLHLTDSWSLL